MNRTFAMSVVMGELVIVPVTVVAQQGFTVGDLLNRGANKLTAEEVQRLHSRSTISGIQAGRSEVTFRNKYGADGSVTGDFWRNGADAGKISGTWSANVNGQACNNLNNGAVNACSYYYSLSGRYYTVQSEEQSAPIYERQITR